MFDDEIYEQLKNKDETLTRFCEVELHDCGQPTDRQEEKCVDEQFNHCICPISQTYRKVSF